MTTERWKADLAAIISPLNLSKVERRILEKHMANLVLLEQALVDFFSLMAIITNAPASMKPAVARSFMEGLFELEVRLKAFFSICYPAGLKDASGAAPLFPDDPHPEQN